jgi:hypothetical protein
VTGVVCISCIYSYPPPWKDALHYNRTCPYYPPEFLYCVIKSTIKKAAYATEPIIHAKPAVYTGLENAEF